MRVVSLFSQKGGVGKTTMTLSFATEAVRRGHKVLAVDIDPQGSLTAWGAQREESQKKSEAPLVVPARAEELPGILDTARAERFDWVFIDTLPRIAKPAVDAARLSDLVVLVAGPTFVDLKAMDKSVDLIRGVGTAAVFLLNKGLPGPGPTGAGVNLEALKLMRDAYGLETYPKPIIQRVAYQYCLDAGQDAVEYGNEKAKRDVAYAFTWLAEQLTEVAAA